MELRLVIRCLNDSRWELLTATLNSVLVQRILICNNKTTKCHQPAHMFTHWPFNHTVWCLQGPSDTWWLLQYEYYWCVNQIFDLKLFSQLKGEVRLVSLLHPPLLSNAAVPDDDSPAFIVKARVEVEDYVTWGTHIHCEPEKQHYWSVKSTCNWFSFFHSCFSEKSFCAKRQTDWILSFHQDQKATDQTQEM